MAANGRTSGTTAAAVRSPRNALILPPPKTGSSHSVYEPAPFSTREIQPARAVRAMHLGMTADAAARRDLPLRDLQQPGRRPRVVRVGQVLAGKRRAVV